MTLAARIGAGTLFFAVSCALSAADTTAWPIGPRSLPPPAHASAELRRILVEAPAPDPQQARERIPTSDAGLREYVARIDAEGAANVDAVVQAKGLRLTHERIAGVPIFRVVPAKIAPEHADQLFVYVHGGAFIRGGGKASASEATTIAIRIGIPVIAIDYRMAPDHQAPAAMDDVVAVWRDIVRQRSAAKTVLGGTSAGANIVLASLLKLKQLGSPLPGAVFVGTPAIDLAKAGDSRFINDGVDRRLVTWDAEAARAVPLYVGKGRLTDPFISPVYGDVRGFPPTYLISGTRDMMLSDTVVMHRMLRRAGVVADLHIYEGQAHVDYALMLTTPESAEHYAELKAFILRHLAT